MIDTQLDDVVARVFDLGERALAVAARGPIASSVIEAIERGVFSSTFTSGSAGDLAVAERGLNHVTIRVHGDARAAVLRSDGKVRWVDGGVARLPSRTTERVLLLVGFEPDRDQREVAEAWLGDGAPARDIPVVWDGWAAHGVTLYGVDNQTRELDAGRGVDSGELISELLGGAELDDHATPAVVRRSLRPQLSPLAQVPLPAVPTEVEVQSRVYSASPICTPAESGPPFAPVLFVSTTPYGQPMSPLRARSRENAALNAPDTVPPSEIPTPAVSDQSDPQQVAIDPGPVEVPDRSDTPVLAHVHTSLVGASSPDGPVPDGAPTGSSAPVESPATGKLPLVLMAVLAGGGLGVLLFGAALLGLMLVL